MPAGEVSSRPSSTVLRQKRRARPLSRFGSDSSDEEYDSDSEEEAEAESEDDEVRVVDGFFIELVGKAACRLPSSG